MAKDDDKSIDEEKKDWMLENFPVPLRWRCKDAAQRERIPLKEWVRKVLLKAAEESETKLVLNFANEGREKSIRRSPPADAKQATAKNVRNKGRKEKA